MADYRSHYREAFKRWLRLTPFSPVHIGGYIRRLYFWREVNRLPVDRWERVLDAGCGDGGYAYEFACRFPQVEVVGLDLQVNCLPQGRSCPNLRLRQENLVDLDEPSEYDFIYSIDTLEHISNNQNAIINLARALKPRGYLYIHIPYDKPGKRIFPERYFAAFDEWSRKEHVGEQYTLEQTCELLKDNRLRVIRKEWTFGLLGELAWELDRLTDTRMLLKVALTPLMKALALISVRIPATAKYGNVLVVGQKPHL